VQVAHVSRLLLVAAPRRTRRIVSTSSAAVRASAGRTAVGELVELVNAEDAFAFYAAWQCPVAFRGDMVCHGEESGMRARSVEG
jgi:hypothetical protein